VKVANEDKNNPKKLWAELSRATGNKKLDNAIPSAIDANSFNECFSTIGQNVAKNITENGGLNWKKSKVII